MKLSLMRVLPAVVVAALVTLSCQTKPLDKAHSVEMSGSAEDAQEAYAQATLACTPSVKPPERSRSLMLAAPVWATETGAYVDWVAGRASVFDTAQGRAVDGLARCVPRVQQINYAIGLTTKPLTVDAYAEPWRGAFFTGQMTVHESHKPIIERAYRAGLSFVNISAREGYAYEGKLVYRPTGRATEFYVYAENHLLLLAPPGEAVLVMRAVTDFGSGSVWRSPYSVVTLTVPSAPSLIAFTLNTAVKGGHARKH